MPDILNIIVQLWPIASTLTPVILLAGFYWLRTKFPTTEAFDALSTKVGAIEAQNIATKADVNLLMEDRDGKPTRIELLDRIAALESRQAGVESGLQSVGKQLHTANEYLQILIERGLSVR